ncbi:MAG: hypothetical protein M1839_005886 [Geoglossum umbratile]|nr:MAG: hypothetical protein M1839_005886 [Geoglossum umbratile]
MRSESRPSPKSQEVVGLDQEPELDPKGIGETTNQDNGGDLSAKESTAASSEGDSTFQNYEEPEHPVASSDICQQEGRTPPSVADGSDSGCSAAEDSGSTVPEEPPSVQRTEMGSQPEALRNKGRQETKNGQGSDDTTPQGPIQDHPETREQSNSSRKGQRRETAGPQQAVTERRPKSHRQAVPEQAKTERQEPRAEWEFGEVQDHVTAMQRNPLGMYAYYKEMVSELRRESKQWESRFNALSEEMLAGRDRYQPVTDGSLRSDMNILRERVRTLAKTAVKSLKVSHGEFCRALSGKTLTLDIDSNAWMETRSRAGFLQSTIWNVLYCNLFCSPFQVYGNEGHVEEAWNHLFQKESVPERRDYCPPPSELCEKWKSLTAIQLDDSVGNEASGYRKTRGELGKLLGSLCKGPKNERTQHLTNVLDSATKLAVTMGQQRCRLELVFPETVGSIRAGAYQGKILNFDDTDDPVEGELVLVVVPGLRKWGDGFGNNLSEYEDLEGVQVKCR